MFGSTRSVSLRAFQHTLTQIQRSRKPFPCHTSEKSACNSGSPSPSRRLKRKTHVLCRSFQTFYPTFAYRLLAKPFICHTCEFRTAKSFACHTSEKRASKSFSCHTFSKFSFPSSTLERTEARRPLRDSLWTAAAQLPLSQ